ncbi:acyl carrier protein [bacterium]|nr:acyl carrier protein [bacterium]
MSLREELVAKVVERLGTAAGEVTDEARFIEDLGADSLDLMDFIMDIENDYDMKISATDAENLKAFGDLFKYIQEKTGK